MLKAKLLHRTMDSGEKGDKARNHGDFLHRQNRSKDRKQASQFIKLRFINFFMSVYTNVMARSCF